MTTARAPGPRAALVDGPLSRTVLRLALPAVASALLTLAFLLVDLGVAMAILWRGGRWQRVPV